MATAKLFGCAISVEPQEEGGGGGGRSIAGEVSRLDGEAVSMTVPPSSQKESNQFFRFLDSNSDSESSPMESEPDLRNCFFNFFDGGSSQFGTTQNIWGFHDTAEGLELGLGIGSGSGSVSVSGSVLGELRGDSSELGLEITGDREVDSGLVEVGTMVADEELEWEDLQNAVTWIQEPFHVRSSSIEEEEVSFLASRGNDHDWEEVWFPFHDFDLIGESGLMDMEFDFLSDDEYRRDYDAVMERMFDDDSAIIGRPPASKSVVDNLPVVEVSSKELRNGKNIVCAICKDEIVAKEKVNRLPCRHYYHGVCIIPWLGIRNTCPVCRYELPTDDVDYERNRISQRRGRSALGTDLMSE